jgi:hypothetical protein
MHSSTLPPLSLHSPYTVEHLTTCVQPPLPPSPTHPRPDRACMLPWHMPYCIREREMLFSLFSFLFSLALALHTLYFVLRTPYRTSTPWPSRGCSWDSSGFWGVIVVFGSSSCTSRASPYAYLGKYLKYLKHRVVGPRTGRQLSVVVVMSSAVSAVKEFRTASDVELNSHSHSHSRTRTIISYRAPRLLCTVYVYTVDAPGLHRPMASPTAPTLSDGWTTSSRQMHVVVRSKAGLHKMPKRATPGTYLGPTVGVTSSTSSSASKLLFVYHVRSIRTEF